MALIKCPECGKEISDKAVACPNCGFPIAEHLDSAPEVQKTEVVVRETEVGTFESHADVGICFIIIGLVLMVCSLFVPVFIIFGLIFGFLCIAYGVGKLKKEASCTCPYCDACGTISEDDINHRCPSCRKISVYVKETNTLKTVE